MNETLSDKFKQTLYENRKAIFWVFALSFTIWLMLLLKEITTLLLLSYGIAIIIDPTINFLERLKFGRSTAIILVGFFLLFLVVLGFIVAIPLAINEYSNLIAALPNYLQYFTNNLSTLSNQYLGITIDNQSLESLITRSKEALLNLRPEHLQKFFSALFNTFLTGYNFTLTIVNMALLPFFVYYVSRDLNQINKFALSFIPLDKRRDVLQVSSEILSHVYAFFRGQITVSFVMAVMYVVGLLIVGMPYAIPVGLIAGLLNIVPYLGIALGVSLSLIITLVNEPSILQIVFVIAVFVSVQFVEGTFLTPKIVGEKVGIHPLAVMLALIIAGQLLGILGLVIAIPMAAACRVLLTYLWRNVVMQEK